MEASPTRKTGPGDALRMIVAVFVLTTAFIGIGTGAAMARDGYDNGHHNYRHHRGGYNRGYVYERPGNYYYAPPPAYYYQPPPPPPALEFVFPLHIR